MALELDVLRRCASGILLAAALGSCSFDTLIEEVQELASPGPTGQLSQLGGMAPAADAITGTVAVQEVAPEPPAPVIPKERIAELLAPPPPRPAVPPRPKNAYDALKYDIELERTRFAQRRAYGEQVDDALLATLNARLTELMDTWKGTRWSYSGTTQVPKKGKIACGYFVSTVLEHAGFVVDRVDLARQPSEQIVRTLVPDPEIERFSRVSRDYVADRVLAQGDGVYIVGLDTHVGFLVNAPGTKKNERVTFCHSTRRDRKAGVVCEEARTSPSLKSRYTVLGKLGAPMLVEAWLAETPLPTARKHQPQPLMSQSPPPRPNIVMIPPVAPSLISSVW
jgi:hypothetical protein